jgi:hypothetical protein
MGPDQRFRGRATGAAPRRAYRAASGRMFWFGPSGVLDPVVPEFFCTCRWVQAGVAGGMLGLAVSS